MEFSETFKKKFIESKSVVFFTGAGVSAESGISTFRGKDGLWNKLKPEELASFNAFMKNPDLVWEWYQYRRMIVNQAKPNPAHNAIAEMEKHKETIVITQNVDNLHRRAGSSKIYELHGNIERNYCIGCNTFYNDIELNTEDKKVPRCKKCGDLIRPDVVWFGEMLPQYIFMKAEEAAGECDILFVVGTSAVVYPAAYIPLNARKSNAYIVEVNVEETEFTRFADYSIISTAGNVLPKILELLK